MSQALLEIATKYVEVIRAIERTSDRVKLQRLEEKRVDLHWKFIEMLKKEGIKFSDREHATKLAIYIADGGDL